MNLLRLGATVIFAAAVTAAFVVVFANHPDRTGARATIQWLLLYLVAIGNPIWWTMEHYKIFRRHQIPMDRKAYGLAWSPVWVGGTTLLIALTLF